MDFSFHSFGQHDHDPPERARLTGGEMRSGADKSKRTKKEARAQLIACNRTTHDANRGGQNFHDIPPTP
ncbi:hypothetical protein JCM15831A_19490 [Asaia astilbis]